MTDETLGIRSPIEDAKLRLVREFLLREFRSFSHEDFYDPGRTAQVFVIQAATKSRHLLVVPKDTFEHGDFVYLMTVQLADALQQTRDVPLILTPDGPHISLR